MSKENLENTIQINMADLEIKYNEGKIDLGQLVFLAVELGRQIERDLSSLNN